MNSDEREDPQSAQDPNEEESGEVGAGSDPVAGSSQSYEAITRDELLLVFYPKSAREDWKTTRYPVSMEDYNQLCLDANEPEPEQLGPGEAPAKEDPAGGDDDDDETNGNLLETAYEEAEEGESIPDSTEPTATIEPAPAAPPKVNSFEGIPATNWQPPDCTCAVGPKDVLVAVNTDLAGYSKTGALRFRWANMTTLFKNVLPSGAKIFDPRVAYDHYAKRWIVVSAATRGNPQGSWYLLGVSKTQNPQGSYWIWALDARKNGNTVTSNWGDYPMLGFDTQAIYITANMFKFGGGFQYTKLRILKKSEVYGGGSIKWYDYWNLKNPDGSEAFTVQPCVHFRGTGGNPPGYLTNALWPGGSKLTLWTLSNPIGYWSGGSASLAKKSISCRSYNLPPDARQKGTTTRIETNDSRLLNAVYQYTGGKRRIWTTQTSNHTWSGDSAARSVVQWYAINLDTSKVAQQNRYGAKGRYYFFPAIHTDGSGNAYVVFGRSSSSLYAQMRYTGRKVSAAKNDLEGSRSVKSGESSYTGGRWGDYFGICRDGGNSNKVWMYGEYADSGNRWGTWVAGSKY